MEDIQAMEDTVHFQGCLGGEKGAPVNYDLINAIGNTELQDSGQNFRIQETASMKWNLDFIEASKHFAVYFNGTKILPAISTDEILSSS